MFFIYFRRQDVRKDSFWEFRSMYRTPNPNGYCQANVTYPFQNPAILLIYRKKWVDSKWFNHALYFSCWFMFVAYIVRNMKSGIWQNIVQRIFNSQVMRREELKEFFVCWIVLFAEQLYIVWEEQPLNIKTESFCLVLLPWKMRPWIWKSRQEKPGRNEIDCIFIGSLRSGILSCSNCVCVCVGEEQAKQAFLVVFWRQIRALIVHETGQAGEPWWGGTTAFRSVQSVPPSCPTLCNPMDCSMTDLPVHHQFPEFTQNHFHWVGDAIQPSHPLPSPSPPSFNLSQHQSFQMSQLFASGGQSIRVSASASVLPMNTQDWSPLR